MKSSRCPESRCLVFVKSFKIYKAVGPGLGWCLCFERWKLMLTFVDVQAYWMLIAQDRNERRNCWCLRSWTASLGLSVWKPGHCCGGILVSLCEGWEDEYNTKEDEPCSYIEYTTLLNATLYLFISQNLKECSLARAPQIFAVARMLAFLSVLLEIL